MAIVNRRNAVLGWLVWKTGKRVGKAKARSAVPSIDRETKRPNWSAVASALAAVGAAVWLVGKKVRHRGGADEPAE